MHSVDWRYTLHSDNIYVEFDKQLAYSILKQMSNYCNWVVVCFTDEFDPNENIVRNMYYRNIFTVRKQKILK